MLSCVNVINEKIEGEDPTLSLFYTFRYAMFLFRNE